MDIGRDVIGGYSVKDFDRITCKTIEAVHKMLDMQGVDWNKKTYGQTFIRFFDNKMRPGSLVADWDIPTKKLEIYVD